MNMSELTRVQKFELGVAVLVPFFIAMGTWWIDSQARARQYASDQRNIVRAFIANIEERRSASGHLRASLYRSHKGGSPDPNYYDQIETRKTEYDGVNVNWNTTFRSNLLGIREILERQNVGDTDVQLQQELIEKLLGKYYWGTLDTCLTKAYDRHKRKVDPGLVLDACSASSRLSTVGVCSAELGEQLFRMTKIPNRFLIFEDPVPLLEEAELMKKCL